MLSMPSTQYALRGPVPLVHLLLRQYLQLGDKALDATCGNGNDTALLAELVGEQGLVWGFDIQEQAISATAGRLKAAFLEERVRLLNCGHEEISKHVSSGLKAAVFNLGYLPGGDRSIITRTETTLMALEQTLQILQPGGILLITIYTGHPGGDGEGEAVAAWATNLVPGSFHVWRMGQMNAAEYAPFLILVQKAA